MKKALLILALAGAAHAAADPLPAAPKLTQDGYVLTDGWNCRTPAALREALLLTGSQAHYPDGCIPVLGARRTNLVAVMRDVAFVCDKLREDLGGGYLCTYAATKYLRAPPDGKPVPERDWSIFDERAS